MDKKTKCDTTALKVVESDVSLKLIKTVESDIKIFLKLYNRRWNLIENEDWHESHIKYNYIIYVKYL